MRKWAVVFLTIACWLMIVAIYGQWCIEDWVRHPTSTDPEGVAIERTAWIQLIRFGLFRFPLLFAGLAAAIWIEIEVLWNGDRS
jgi:hypothetical protein